MDDKLVKKFWGSSPARVDMRTRLPDEVCVCVCVFVLCMEVTNTM